MKIQPISVTVISECSIKSDGYRNVSGERELRTNHVAFSVNFPERIGLQKIIRLNLYLLMWREKMFYI